MNSLTSMSEVNGGVNDHPRQHRAKALTNGGCLLRQHREKALANGECLSNDT